MRNRPVGNIHFGWGWAVVGTVALAGMFAGACGWWGVWVALFVVGTVTVGLTWATVNVIIWAGLKAAAVNAVASAAADEYGQG